MPGGAPAGPYQAAGGPPHPPVAPWATVSAKTAPCPPPTNMHSCQRGWACRRLIHTLACLPKLNADRCAA